MSDLPPLDQPQVWIVVRGSEQAGPYTLDLLINEVVAGRLPYETPIWWAPLRDWTTMSAHGGVAAEVNRRRSASAPSWMSPTADYSAATTLGQGTVPASPAQPYAQPGPAEPAPAQTFDGSPLGDASSLGGVGVPESPSVFSAPVPQSFEAGPDAAENRSGAEATAGSPNAEPDLATDSSEFAEPSQDIHGGSEQVETTGEVQGHLGEDDVAVAEVADTEVGDPDPETEPSDTQQGDIEDAVIIEAQAVDANPLAGSVRSDFASIVARSRQRFERLRTVTGIDEKFVQAALDAAQNSGFALDERVDVDRGHELKFKDSSDAALLVISLAELNVTRADDISAAVLPVTVSVRSDQHRPATPSHEVDDEHGQVVIRPDDWTGQTTSTVSLFIGAEDYLDSDFQVNGAALQRDLRAMIETVKSALV